MSGGLGAMAVARGDASRVLSPAARVAGRAATRSIGVLTAPARPLPEFLIIGTKRGGTTSMYRYLLAHPQVLPLFPSARRLPLRADRKGIHYLDAHFGAGPTWYRSHFASRPYRRVVERRVGHPVVSGEATPYYLFHPHAAERAAAALPAVRIIVLLRNPVDRAHSHYKEQRRRGYEPLATFSEAIEAEPRRLAGEAERLERDPSHRSFAHEHQSYVAQGMYLPSLERWLRRLPNGQVHVMRSEDLYADPQAAYDGVVEFLGLSGHRLPSPDRFNLTADAPVDLGLRRSLVERFVGPNAALEARLGRSFGWDRP